MSELKMQALQSQMNPHFIFNSLNSIQSYITNKDTLYAATYLAKFSRLMRNILDNSNHILIPLDQILETLKLYLEIEAFRFNDEFQYSLEMEDNDILLETKLPPMLLQPFVENSIWHGLMPLKGLKKLFIKIYYENESIVCLIEDNGVGRNIENKKEGHISRGQLMIKGMLESMKQLQNVEVDLRIIDKKDFQDKSVGTIVVITIPVLK
jgi:LytS/YehU family sensor histidine kinase